MNPQKLFWPHPYLKNSLIGPLKAQNDLQPEPPTPEKKVRKQKNLTKLKLTVYMSNTQNPFSVLTTTKNSWPGSKSFKKRVKLSYWDWIIQLKFTSTSIYLNSIWLWHHSNPISCIVYTMQCWIPSWDSWSIGSSVSPSVSQSTKFHILYKSWLF